MKRMSKDPDMLEEYDFSGGIRGKYAKRYEEGTNVVVIDPDVASIFPDHDAVNDALCHPRRHGIEQQHHRYHHHQTPEQHLYQRWAFQ